MKTIIPVILALLSLQVQAQWHPVNSNTTETLFDLFLTDSLNGYCVGGTNDWGSAPCTGVILETTDGGENWNTLFSMDSISIKNVAVVEENGNIKLYGFGLKNGNPHLVSTFLNSPFQNWTVLPINYRPIETVVHDNKIYFIDDYDHLLKVISNGSLSTITSTMASIFHVNDEGITFVNDAVDHIFHSANHAEPFTALPQHPTNFFGQNQITGAEIYKQEDILVITCTYPNRVLSSLDGGLNWVINEQAPGSTFNILGHQSIYSIGVQGTIQHSRNAGSSWQTQYTLTGNPMNASMTFTSYSTGFALGENGLLLKTTIEDEPLSVTENKDPKKINIYPNPGNGTVAIQVDGNLRFSSISLTDMNGLSIKKFSANASKLDISDISQGSYFLKFETETGMVIKSLIID